MEAADTRIIERCRAAAEVARAGADAVDRDARFPEGAILALRDARLLAAAIPPELGGLGYSITELARLCSILGGACASTSMIFAMHHIQVLCLVRHADADLLHEFVRDTATNQWLIASGTSEVGVDGNLRSSVTAVERRGERFALRKHCPVLSYGRQADAVLLTARAAPDAAPGDQVLVLVRKDDFEIEETGPWDAMGMRGTCSPAVTLTAEAATEQILHQPFRTIASQTMVPCSHILWSACWLGIAREAISIGRSVAQRRARADSMHSVGSDRLARAVNDLHVMEAAVRTAAAEYDAISTQPASANVLSSILYSARINDLKITAARLVSRICLSCLESCGMRGYLNGSDASVARHVRDALSAPLMISNDRLTSTNATLLLTPEELPDW